MLDTVSRAASAPTSDEQGVFTAADPDLLAKAFASLDVDTDWKWAWYNYKRVVRELTAQLGARRLIDIGGGRDPLFDLDELETLGAALTVNDIAPGELSRLPPGYDTACFDVAGDRSCLAPWRNTFDLAFSRMVFEHVADGRRAWSNLYDLLAPGGIALSFNPTLYALPYVINWLLPHKLTAPFVRRFGPERSAETDPVFPAVYSWCSAEDARMRAMLSAIGYREIIVQPFYGHSYYGKFPVVRDVHARFTALARQRDWRMVASFAYIIARK
jgi:SAM-dependent methyltransferase